MTTTESRALPACLSDAEHTCTTDCSVQFWTAFGCNVTWINRRQIVCDDHEDGVWLHAVPRSILPNIMADPSSDRAWLSMKVILLAARERDWSFTLTKNWCDIHTPKHAPGCPVATDELPRSVAVAYWRALLQEGRTS